MNRVEIDNKSLKSINKILKKNHDVSIAFDRAVEKLRNNPSAGQQIRKEQIPKKIISEFRLVNLYKYDLIRKHPGWRMLYTITKEGDVKILVLILRILDHHQYDRLFHYD